MIDGFDDEYCTICGEYADKLGDVDNVWYCNECYFFVGDEDQ